MTRLRPVLANTGWLIGDRVLRMLLGLFVGVMVVRYLGPEQYGLLSYALALVSLAVPVTALGLDQIVIRDVVRDPACTGETLGTAFLLKLAGACLAFLGLIMVVAVIRPGDTMAFSVVCIVAVGPVFQAVDTIDLWFQSQIQAKYTVYAKNAAFTLLAVTKLALVHLQAPLVAFAVAASAELFVGAIGLVVMYRLQRQSPRAWRGSLVRARSLLAQSWPFILATVASMVYTRGDVLILGALLGDRAVGIYAAARTVSEMWYFVPVAVVSSTFPILAASRVTSEESYYANLQKLFVAMVAIGYVVAIPMTLVSNIVVAVLFGANYALAGPVLAVHVWAGVFMGLGAARVTGWDINEGLLKFTLATTGTAAMLSVALNLILIPLAGPVGSAFALLASQAVAAFLMCFVFPRGRPVGRMMLRALVLKS